MDLGSDFNFQPFGFLLSIPLTALGTVASICTCTGLYLHTEMGVNHKKVQRDYRELGLNVRRTRRRHLRRALAPRPVLTAPNQEWALDFASDVKTAGQRFRVLGVRDNFARQARVLEAATSFPSRRVTRELERAMAAHGKPHAIRCDHGPELTSRHFLAWAIEWKIDLVHIQPGEPTQNGGMESFNGKLRDECLNVSWFWKLFDARRKISDWKIEYHSRRPHSSLGYLTPDDFARRWQQQGGGKNAGCARSENACGVAHFTTAPTTTMNLV
jgi:putative transposase